MCVCRARIGVALDCERCLHPLTEWRLTHSARAVGLRRLHGGNKRTKISSRKYLAEHMCGRTRQSAVTWAGKNWQIARTWLFLYLWFPVNDHTRTSQGNSGSLTAITYKFPWKDNQLSRDPFVGVGTSSQYFQVIECTTRKKTEMSRQCRRLSVALSGDPSQLHAAAAWTGSPT
jgi:hypothetical protein